MSTLLTLLARPQVLLGLGLAAVVLLVYLLGRGDGADSVREQVRTDIEESREAGRDVFTSAETCEIAGLEWDQTTGRCS